MFNTSRYDPKEKLDDSFMEDKRISTTIIEGTMQGRGRKGKMIVYGLP